MAIVAGKERTVFALEIAGPLVMSLLAAGCAGSSGVKVARVGTTGSGRASAPPNAGPRAFSACMRRHGVPNFPDPDPEGRIQVGPEIDDRSAVVGAAYRACRTLAPSEDSITGQGDVMQQEQLLAFARCMRSHGVPAFPDPQVVNGHIRIRVTAGQIDPSSPVVTAATAACRSTLGKFGDRGAQKLVQGAAGPPPLKKGK
jgi:hypothetical protein